MDGIALVLLSKKRSFAGFMVEVDVNFAATSMSSIWEACELLRFRHKLKGNVFQICLIFLQ